MFNLFKKLTGTAIICERCGSKQVHYGNVVKTQEHMRQTMIRYDVSCKDCGASGKVTEVWD
jgi:uncharacterized Zn finger protein